MILKISTLLFILSYNLFAIDGKPFSTTSADSDYVYIQSTSSYYKYHAEELSWSDAVSACSSEGAQLFYPEDEAEARLVAETLHVFNDDTYYIWLGISDLDVIKRYKTVDGRSISDVYHDWDIGEPSSGSEDACRWVTLKKSYKLFVACPTWKEKFICKRSVENQVGTSTPASEVSDYVSIESLNGLYKFHDESVSWSDAVSACSSEGAQLFYPEDEAEARAVTGALHVFNDDNNYRIWLGISDIDVIKRYKTVDGRSISDVYHDWDRGEPYSGSKDNCRWVTLKKNYKLYVACPSWSEKFICKRSVENQVGTSTPASKVSDYVSIESLNGLYKFHDESVSWSDAVSACSSEGAQLFYPEDEAEARAVTGALHVFNDDNNYRIWLGISDIDVIKQYKTVDGRSLSAVYHDWDRGEPNSGSANACRWVTLKKTYKLFVGCPSWREKFICKRSVENQVGASTPASKVSDYVSIESSNGLYKLHDERVSWSDAVAACSSEGAQLFYPEDEGEARAVTLALHVFNDNINNIWIGISDLDVVRRYKTVDGRPLSAVYHDWDRGEPNSGYDDTCRWVTLNINYKLYVACPSWSEKFICKRSLESQATTETSKPSNLPLDLQQYIYQEKTRSYYKFYEDELSWQAAGAACAADGAELYYPTDAEEAAAVGEHIVNWDKTHAIFIAVSDLEQIHNYKTTDGRSINDLYNNWDEDEPNSGPGGSYRCVTQWQDKTLWVSRCEVSRPFVCKYTPGSSAQTTTSEATSDVTPSYVPYITTVTTENKLCSGVECSQTGGSESDHFGAVVAEELNNFPTKQKLLIMESILKVIQDHWAAAQHSCDGNDQQHSRASQLQTQNE